MVKLMLVVTSSPWKWEKFPFVSKRAKGESRRYLLHYRGLQSVINFTGTQFHNTNSAHLLWILLS